MSGGTDPPDGWPIGPSTRVPSLTAGTSAGTTKKEIPVAKTTMGKTRGVDNPYLVVVNDIGWTYKVLKAYSADPDKPYARWFTDVHGFGHDMGDTYVADVTGTVTYRDPVVTDADLPSHLKGGPKLAKGFDW
jgi:hypothetical protein